MNCAGHAHEREKAFLHRHGVKNYHLLDLRQEVLEELADAWNYASQMDGGDRLRMALQMIESAYSLVEQEAMRDR